MNYISSDNIPVGPRCNIYIYIYLATGVSTSPPFSALVSYFHDPFISSAVMLKRRGTVSLQLTAYTNAHARARTARTHTQSSKHPDYLFFFFFLVNNLR